MEKKLFEERIGRVKKAIALEEADRVPFIPMITSLVTSSYGASLEDAMMDQRTIIPALDRMLEDMKPDCVKAPDYFSKKAMNILNPININYPGHGSESVYQVVDHAFMDDEEYEDF